MLWDHLKINQLKITKKNHLLHLLTILINKFQIIIKFLTTQKTIIRTFNLNRNSKDSQGKTHNWAAMEDSTQHTISATTIWRNIKITSVVFSTKKIANFTISNKASNVHRHPKANSKIIRINDNNTNTISNNSKIRTNSFTQWT